MFSSKNKGEDNFSSPKEQRGFSLELLKIFLVAILAIVGVRYYLFKPFYVKGASMEPNFYEHEYLIIDEITYRLKEGPERGDTTVLRYPADTSDFFLKRVIGLPGERVQIRNGAVYIFTAESPNGRRLVENYLSGNDRYTTGDIDITLGEDEYFVLGDNRDASFDSRKFGAVRRDLFVGRVWLRGWPLNRFGRYDAPEYN